MYHNMTEGSQTDPTGYHQIHQTQHFFRKNDKAESDQTGQKRGEKLKKNVPVEKSNQCTRRNEILGQTEKIERLWPPNASIMKDSPGFLPEMREKTLLDHYHSDIY